LIGQKKESPSIVDDLLDIEKYPCKPQYQICSEHPLVLFDCQYENVDWLYERGEVERVIKHLQDLWVHHQTQATIVKRMIDSLEKTLEDDTLMDKRQKINPLFTNLRSIDQPYTSLQGKNISLTYIKFEDRIKSKSLDEKVEHYVKRQRLDANVYGKINEANELAKSLNIYKPSHNLDDDKEIKMVQQSSNE
jgi:tRNA pseudouridine38/39 synthase